MRIEPTILLLAVTPHTSKSLLIGCRVPIWIEQNQAIGTNEIETATTGLAAQQEDKLVSIRVVELVDQLLTLVDVHRSVKPKEAISTAI